MKGVTIQNSEIQCRASKTKSIVYMFNKTKEGDFFYIYHVGWIVVWLTLSKMSIFQNDFLSKLRWGTVFLWDFMANILHHKFSWILFTSGIFSFTGCIQELMNWKGVCLSWHNFFPILLFVQLWSDFRKTLLLDI